jgi:integral membrane protein (TIGR01906 family)
LIATAAALVILGASIAPFLTPVYVHFEQSRTAVYSNTGMTWAEIDRVTTSILSDLVFWQGDFGVQVASRDVRSGEPALTDDERAHMRDVRNVFTGLWVLVLAGIVTLTVALRRTRGPERARAWRSVRDGAGILAVVIAVAGVFAVVAFDTAFEVFHRLFFSSGTYTFDPAHSRLIQLFPERFWSETALAVGSVIVGVAVLTTWLAGRRARRIGVAA